MVENLVLPRHISGAVKRVFVTINIWTIKKSEFMPANHSITNRIFNILVNSVETHFKNVFVMLLQHFAKDMTLLLLSWHKHYDFNCCKFFTS